MPKLRCICGASKAPRKELAVLKAKLANALAQIKELKKLLKEKS